MDAAFSDVGSSISQRVGNQPSMAAYDPYSYRSYPGQYPTYGAPSAGSYYSYAPNNAYSAYTTYGDSSRGYSSAGHGNMYYGYNGKLIRSFKIRSHRKAQKHVLNLFPEGLNGIASSRIQFYVMRPGYDSRGYVGVKSYISKKAWPTEIDNLADHETVGIDVRPSISFGETIASCCNRSMFL